MPLSRFSAPKHGGCVSGLGETLVRLSSFLPHRNAAAMLFREKAMLFSSRIEANPPAVGCEIVLRYQPLSAPRSVVPNKSRTTVAVMCQIQPFEAVEFHHHDREIGAAAFGFGDVGNAAFNRQGEARAGGLADSSGAGLSEITAPAACV